MCFLDLLSTKFMLDYSTRPMHFFGFFGLLLTGAGASIGCSLAFKKLVLHKAIMLQNGPLLFAATLLILVGVQLLCLGLLAEILSRTYYESQGKPIYAVREIRSHDPQSTLATAQTNRSTREDIPGGKAGDDFGRFARSEARANGVN